MFSLNGPISEKSSGAGLVAVQGIFKSTGFIIFQLCQMDKNLKLKYQLSVYLPNFKWQIVFPPAFHHRKMLTFNCLPKYQLYC